MESLIDKFSSLSLSPSKDLKTGVVHHLKMLLHALDHEDLGKSQKHVENPKRLLSILGRLKETSLDSQCKVISEFGPCPTETIELIHPKDYIEYFDEMFCVCLKGDTI